MADYVSRGAEKLESVVGPLGIDFRNKLVLDVGSSTGGFTDFALQHGAEHVVAVDSGTNQLHSKLREDPRVELYERTDIRELTQLKKDPDIIVIDVSFISLIEIMDAITKLAGKQTDIVAMVKPQFEAKPDELHRGIVKNNHIRRDIFKRFETAINNRFQIINKADSKVAGSHGNLERFYLLHLL